MTNETKETLLLGYRARLAALRQQVSAMLEKIVAIEAELRGKPVKRARAGKVVGVPAAARGGKRKMTPEGRARIAAAQKKRWAAKRGETAE